MATTDKARNTAQKAKGKAKETVGTVTGNQRLRRKGKVDQFKARVKQTGEKLKKDHRHDLRGSRARSLVPDRVEVLRRGPRGGARWEIVRPHLEAE
jgi:uncharacterized protein YjbJ (UPF0337 family)